MRNGQPGSHSSRTDIVPREADARFNRCGVSVFFLSFFFHFPFGLLNFLVLLGGTKCSCSAGRKIKIMTTFVRFLKKRKKNTVIYMYSWMDVCIFCICIYREIYIPTG